MNEDKAREAQEREEMRAWHETKAACDPSDWSTAESAAYRGFFVHGFRAALQWAASQQAAEGWRPMESVPKEPGRYIYVQQQAVYRWLPYKANSQEFKRGKKGRWQKHTGFGFDNAELEGQGWRDADESAPLSTQGGADEQR